MEFSYDFPLVALSIAIAVLGSFTGLVMTVGIRRVGRKEAALRVALASFGVGVAIWAMHFVAMLALILPVKLRFAATPIAASAAIPVAFTALALAIAGWRWLGRFSLPVGAVGLGLGIAGMHFAGMAAMRGGGAIAYSWGSVALSILIAIHVSAVALWLAFRERGFFDTVLGALALGLAMTSMHYLAMETTRFVPADALAAPSETVVSDAFLALTIALAVYGVCGVCLFVFAVLTHIRRSIHPHQRGAGS